MNSQELEKNVLEANHKELGGFVHLYAAELPRELGIVVYARALLAYLGGDIAELEGLLRSDGIPSHIQKLIEIRLRIRRKQLIADEEVGALFYHDFPEHWRGEIHFVAALAASAQEQFVRAKEQYSLACAAFKRAGCERKAIKALLNKVVAESRINPEKRQILDYIFISDEAHAVGEHNIVGVCSLNISREYQLLGALEMALRYAHEAVAALDADIGSAQYFYAIAQRAHIFLELGRLGEANLDKQKLLASNLPEMEAVRAAIDCCLRGDAASFPSELKVFLAPTWRERLSKIAAGDRPPSKLGILEGKLLELLGAGPLSPHELIVSLYGKKIIHEAGENRLRVLVSRVRKKAPGLVIFFGGKYALADGSDLVFQVGRRA